MENNLATMFLNRVSRRKDRAGISYKSEDRWIPYTWEQVGHRVERIGRALIRSGIKPHEKIAILSTNRPEWVMADLAILSIGAVSVPIYPNTTPEQAKYILKHSESKALFLSGEEGIKIIKAIGEEIPEVELIVWFDQIETFQNSKHHLLENFEKTAEDVDPTLFYDRVEKINPDNLATIVYTSGTTGEPKGVMLSHTNILSNALASAEVFPVSEDDHCLSFLPLSHALERTAGFFTMLHVGAQISYAESIAKVGQNLKEVKPTIIVCVPRILEKMYGKIQSEVSEKPKFVQFLFKKAAKSNSKPFLGLSNSLFFQKIKDEMGGRLQYIVCGGAAMSPEIGNFFEQVGFEILEGYGLTETSPVVSVNLPKQNRIGTVGKALPGVEIQLAHDGEVLVKGPNVMKGYYKDSKATEATFDNHGYFKTGDIGIFEEGYLKLTDRKKELIVTSGGKNIAPTPIENQLKTEALVEHACIVGDGQKYIAALLVPNFFLLEKKAAAASIPVMDRTQLCAHEEVKKWFQAIVDKTNAKLAGFETIKKFAIIPNEFSIETGEITPTLKLKRKNILQKYSDVVHNLF